MVLMEMMVSFRMQKSVKSLKDDFTVMLDKMVLASIELHCVVCFGRRVWNGWFWSS